MNTILEMLEKDAKMSTEQIACALGCDVSTVEAQINEFEDKNVVLGYKALIDWDKTDKEAVTALIEVKVVPQRGLGFARVAERISQYDEVESVYLMSGGFDIAVMICGRSLKEVASFVSEKLAPLEAVKSTATHFVLKKFKDKGVIFSKSEEKQERLHTI